MPMWGWVLLVAAALTFLAARSYYKRFRAMCRSVRDDLTTMLKAEHPEMEVLGERRGDLALRRPDGPEIIWPMADIYAEVARLPNLGADPRARQAIYRRSVDALMIPPVDPEHPPTLDEHGGRIKPLLLPPLATGQSPAVTQDVPELGLRVAYALDLPSGKKPVTPAFLEALGLTVAELHELALRNLAADFPQQMVESALRGDAAAVQLGDGFDATRLLLVPGLLSAEQELAAVIPHRDMMILLRASDDAELERAREGARMAAEEAHEHPRLLDRPVRVTRQGFALL